MKLYFIRHAIAIERGRNPSIKDSARPLTEEGIQKFRQCCSGFKKLGIEFDLILTSPYLRAKQTSDILATELGLKDITKTSELLTPGHTVHQLNTELKKLKLQSVALIGHEPSLSQHLSHYISGTQHCQSRLKKGSIALVEFQDQPEVGQGHLKFLVPPSILKHLGSKIKK